MKKKLYQFLSIIKLFFSLSEILIGFKKKKPKFVFFSENKTYQNYSTPIIETLIKKYSHQVYYFSIDKEDVIENKNIKNYYVNPLLLNYFFNNIKCENMFLTVTDLGNSFPKKTENVDKYIYYFHAPVSTTKNYKPKAFDNYDIIFCNGQFQIDEIKYRESIKRLKNKKLIPTGYFYFDYLKENINNDIISDEILIAPSWNLNLKNYINENFFELIHTLLKKKIKVTFRPHPENLKRSKDVLDKVKNKFLCENFTFDTDFNNIKSMEKARCLITDSSGIALEYLILFKRPVLYLDEHDKIHNSEFKEFASFKTIDHTFRENFGYLFNSNDFENIETIIKNSEKNFMKNLYKLDGDIKNIFSNYGKTKEYLYKNMDKIF